MGHPLRRSAFRPDRDPPLPAGFRRGHRPAHRGDRLDRLEPRGSLVRKHDPGLRPQRQTARPHRKRLFHGGGRGQQSRNAGRTGEGIPDAFRPLGRNHARRSPLLPRKGGVRRSLLRARPAPQTVDRKDLQGVRPFRRPAHPRQETTSPADQRRTIPVAGKIRQQPAVGEQGIHPCGGLVGHRGPSDRRSDGGRSGGGKERETGTVGIHPRQAEPDPLPHPRRTPRPARKTLQGLPRPLQLRQRNGQQTGGERHGPATYRTGPSAGLFLPRSIRARRRDGPDTRKRLFPARRPLETGPAPRDGRVGRHEKNPQAGDRQRRFRLVGLVVLR